MPTIQQRAVSPRSRRSRKIRGWIMLFVGFAVSLWLIVEGLDTRSIERPVPNGITTTGTTIGYRVAQEWDNDYRPVVAFMSADGQRIVFSAPALKKRPTVGSVVSVSYDPRNPTTAHDLSDTALWREEFYVGLFGFAVLFLLTLLVVWLNARHRRTQPPL